MQAMLHGFAYDVCSAAGDPDITIYTDALVAYDGRILWQPPAIYKSFCPASFIFLRMFHFYLVYLSALMLPSFPFFQKTHNTANYARHIPFLSLPQTLQLFYGDIQGRQAGKEGGGR